MTLNVPIAAMVSSALQVNSHGEDLAVCHMAADNRMAAAAGGWQGRSAQALSARLAAWNATSQDLLGRLRDHAQGLLNCAEQFAIHDQQSRDELDAVHAP